MEGGRPCRRHRPAPALFKVEVPAKECCCFVALKVLSKLLGGVHIKWGQRAPASSGPGVKAVSQAPTGFKQTDQSDVQLSPALALLPGSNRVGL